MATALPHDCVPVPSNHPLYVLYTSGTTGTPKVLPLQLCYEKEKGGCKYTFYHSVAPVCLKAVGTVSRPDPQTVPDINKTQQELECMQVE